MCFYAVICSKHIVLPLMILKIVRDIMAPTISRSSFFTEAPLALRMALTVYAIEYFADENLIFSWISRTFVDIFSINLSLHIFCYRMGK